MGKRWRKQKAGTQRTKRPRGRTEQGTGGSGSSMGAMRRGLQRFFGGGPGGTQASNTDKVLNGILVVAVLVAAVIFMQRRCL